MADLTPEQNDFLSYIVHRSRRAAILDMNNVYMGYRAAMGINPNDAPDDAQLTTIFNLLLEKINDLLLLPRRKAKLIFSIQGIPQFEALFGRGEDMNRIRVIREENGNMTIVLPHGERFPFTEADLNNATLIQRNAEVGPAREYTAVEINDWLMYVAESSRTARRSLKMHDNCTQYQADSGISRSVETLEVQFRLIIAPQLENANLLLMTRALACYATKTSVSSVFLRDLSLAQISVKPSINITKFKPRGYVKRPEHRERISDTDWDEVYENAMMDYLEDDASPGELKLAAVWRDFGEEYLIRHGDRAFHQIPKTIETHFLKEMKPEICSLVNRYDLSTLARMCLIASAPINEDLLQKLQQHANNNDIIFEFARYIKTLPVTQNRVQPYNMGAAAGGNLLEGLNTWTEVEDNDLLGYIASRAWNGERLLINEILRTYKGSSGSGRGVEDLRNRFDNHLRHRIESSQYLHLTRLKMLYATDTLISPEFRQTLTRLRINTVVNGIDLLAPDAPEVPPIQAAQAAPVAPPAQEAPGAPRNIVEALEGLNFGGEAGHQNH